MYLKKLQIFNFRKFRENDNIIGFADPSTFSVLYKNSKSAENNTKILDKADDMSTPQNKFEKKIEAVVASTTTLIVGKNNAGKTTVIEALDKLINKEMFYACDFNLSYIHDLMKTYGDNRKTEEYECPKMTFVFTIGLDKGKEDYITNISSFMSLGDKDASELNIVVKYELAEVTEYITEVSKLMKLNDIDMEEDVRFSKLLEIIDKSKFEIKYYDNNRRSVEKFKLKQLIQLTYIRATVLSGEGCLTKAFNKIIKYRYEDSFTDEKDELDKNIANMNSQFTLSLRKHHTNEINNSLSSILSKDDVQVSLTSDITFEKLMQNLIKYEYREGGSNIPEEQFGTGYSNLMMIIAQIIDYMEKYPKTSFNSKINLIGIEEPEAHMHPQMQELFISYINDAVNNSDR